MLFSNDSLSYFVPLSSYFADMASAAFIEPLPVIEFVAQLLGKDVLSISRTLSDADRVKVIFLNYLEICLFVFPRNLNLI